MKNFVVKYWKGTWLGRFLEKLAVLAFTFLKATFFHSIIFTMRVLLSFVCNKNDQKRIHDRYNEKIDWFAGALAHVFIWGPWVTIGAPLYYILGF